MRTTHGISRHAKLARVVRAATLLLPFFLLTACGGGSGGGSSSGSSGGPSATPPPTVEIDDNVGTVLSGGSFGTTVGGTADGLSATVGVTCTNGVGVSANGGTITFTIPGTSTLIEAVCTARVTDSIGRSASTSLRITILPRTAIGQVVGIFNPPLELLTPNFNIAGVDDSTGSNAFAVRASTTRAGRFQVKALAGPQSGASNYHRDDIVGIPGDYASIDFVQSPSLYAHGLPEASLSIASPSENKVDWLVQDPQSRDFTVRETINVELPCFVAQTNTYWANDMVVGQRDHGLTVFDIDTGSDVQDSQSFTATRMYNVGEGRSLCHVFRGVIPTSVIEQYPGFLQSPPAGPNYSAPLTAIDYDSNELVFYGDIDGDNKLDEMGAMPIETGYSSRLDIVQVISRGLPTQEPRYLIVLFSDGQHPGHHSVVQIEFDNHTYEITQRVLHQWTEGVPVSMLQGPLGGSMVGGIFRSDLVVVLGTTEQSFFFDDLLPLEAGFSLPPQYGEPQLFNVGVGANSAIAALSPFVPTLTAPDHGVLVSYTGTGDIVYIPLPMND
jgi:hypothetical protein